MLDVVVIALGRRWDGILQKHFAGGQVLGRLASQIANVLRGKNKPTFTPHADAGDFVDELRPFLAKAKQAPR